MKPTWHSFLRPIDPPDDWANLKYHQLSQLGAFGAGADLEAIAADMMNHGYDPRKPIILFQDEILDGRFRHQGAIKAGVVPCFVQFTGDWMTGLLLIRREQILRQHLDASQRSMFAARFVAIKHDGLADKLTQAEAAETFGVSTRSVGAAAKVIEEGVPELVKAVDTGDLKVSTAAQIADEKPEVQRELVKDAGPAQCKRCREKGTVPNCPACAKEQERQDKPKKKKKTVKKPKADKDAAPPFTWKEFDAAMYAMETFMLNLYGVRDQKGISLFVDRLARMRKEIAAWREQHGIKV